MTTSLTKAGHNSSPGHNAGGLVDAIDQVFVLFRVNYHNQYYKAFPDTTTLNITKKLWLQSLRDVAPTALLSAAETLVRSQDYLPTLSQMLREARKAAGESLPDVHTAFLEACNAPSPKAAFTWSHPIVFHAGKATGWRRLATQPEQVSYPIFRHQFARLEQDFLNGKSLALPAAGEGSPAEDSNPEPLSAEETHSRIRALRKALE